MRFPIELADEDESKRRSGSTILYRIIPVVVHGRTPI